MLATVLLLSLSAFTATVSASAIPQNGQHGGLVKRQNTATIPTFSFGPSTTVYLSGGTATNATSSGAQQTSATDTSSATATASAGSGASTATKNAGSATGTIPTYDFFPSSTVPVSPGATSQPATGGGNNGGESNTGGSKSGSGAGDGTGDNGQAGDEDSLEDLANLLQGLIDLFGN
ncbi:hypothetical protein F5Y09DRAFT_324969 [Xylaria sp. FL1042]|nr:hypothetical protein F5Y09DRAFT_324969 [Xylaria sp. FL1042]